MNTDSQDIGPFSNAPQLESKSKMTPLLLVLVVLMAFVAGAGALYLLTLQSPVKKEKEVVQVVDATPTPQFFLSVDTPSEDAVTVDDEVLVTGKTRPGAMVAIFTANDETVVETDKQGYFEETVSLDASKNTLIVSAFGSEGEEQSVTLEVNQSP